MDRDLRISTPARIKAGSSDFHAEMPELYCCGLTLAQDFSYKISQAPHSFKNQSSKKFPPPSSKITFIDNVHSFTS